MKTKVLIIVLVCIVLQTKAQTTDTNTIVNDNSSWATLYSWWGFADTVILYNSTSYYFFDGDTLFNEKIYRKVFEYNDEQHVECFFAGLIREENKKTYFVPYKVSLDSLLEESILYDFTLKTGDTLKIDGRNFRIEKCDTVIFNGEPRKRMILAIHYSYVDTVIETVGSFSGLLSPLYYDNTGFRELLCYTQNNELLYKNPKYSECYYNNLSVSIMPTIEQNHFSVFPNPVDDRLTISCLNNTILRIEIFDAFGRQLYNQTDKDKIDMSSFSKGLYLLKVYDINEHVSVFKIIKN